MTVLHRYPAGGEAPLALAVGSFDGVHRGHAAVLRGLVAAARARGLEPAVLTFEPLPREHFAGERAPPRLTRLGEKIPLLAALGVARTVVLHFDRALADLPARTFVERVLADGLRTRLLAVGEDFRFGRGREGDLALLREEGGRHGFELLPIAAVSEGSERISSSRIRERLLAGDLEEAHRLLGRPYALEGRVIHGLRLARRLGWPTANIAPGRRRLALCGVFAVRVAGLGPSPYNGVASLGVRPGFGDGRELIEVHLFGYDGPPFYGRRLRVTFVARIRDEWTFASADALARQIALDVEAARRLLAGTTPDPDGGSPTGG